MWWISLITLLILVGVYLLFAPLVLYVDTMYTTYILELKGLVRASIETDNAHIFKIRLQTALMHFDFYPLRKKKGNRAKKSRSKRTKKGRNLSPAKIVALLRTFKINTFKLDLDTGDFTMNAKLYPIAGFLNHQFGTYSINFQGRNRMVLKASNRPINIIRVFINT